jgi:hypothetical protein
MVWISGPLGRQRRGRPSFIATDAHTARRSAAERIVLAHVGGAGFGELGGGPHPHQQASPTTSTTVCAVFTAGRADMLHVVIRRHILGLKETTR